MTPLVTDTGWRSGTEAALRLRAERRRQPSRLALSPGPRRLMLASIMAIALLLSSVCVAVWYAVSSIDAASIAAEQERAAAALSAVVKPDTVIDESLALRLEQEFSLGQARFLSAGTPAAEEVSLPAPGATDTLFAWVPRRFGTELALLLAPIRLAVSAVCLIGLGWLLFRLYRLATELEERRHEAQQLALRDTLTGLGNRLAFDEGLEQLAKRKAGGALLYLDLDDFKRVNDSLGHGAGDELLRVLAGRLSAFAGEGDVLARIGGDEFALLQTTSTSRAEIAELASDIAAAVGEPVRIGPNEVSVGTCIGIAMVRDHSGGAADLVRAADSALYRAKALGDGCFLFAGKANGAPTAAAV